MNDARHWRSDLPEVEVGGAGLPEFLLGRADLPADKAAMVDGRPAAP